MLRDVQKPTKDEWGSGIDALVEALALEKSVNQSLLDMHTKAGNHNDGHLTNFLEDHFLEEQVHAIKELSEMITRLKRAGSTSLGEYMFDKEIYQLRRLLKEVLDKK